MIRPQRYFAWTVARQILLFHVLIYGVVLLFLGFSIHFFAHQTFVNSGDLTGSLGHFDWILAKILFVIFGIGALVFIFPAYKYAQPLGRLIQRARELRRLDTDIDQAIREEETSEDPGEWYDLERALNRIHKDLRTQTEALAHEREELSALIGAVSQAIFAIDKEENSLFYNGQFSLLFRSASSNKKQLSLGEVFRTPEILSAFREVLKDGQMRIVETALRVRLQDLPRHFSVSIAPLHVRSRANESVGIEGAVGVFHDVTELKQAEQIRIEFVANASHELRTPLTSIKGYVDTLRDDVNTGRLSNIGKYSEIISRNVDRMILLVSDLLDLSTLDSGAELEKHPVSTIEVTESVLRQLEGKRLIKNHQIRVHNSAPSLLADASRLEQILVNLVYNAFKYTPGGSRIDIFWEPSSEGVLLKVKDNGPGISSAHQARLFERFYRVDAGRSREQGGTGLGLAIVKHIMIKHGGSVRVHSELGQGAEFICVFPD